MSQIHSAKIEYAGNRDRHDVHNARIVLVTSLGMIAVNEDYLEDAPDLDDACKKINGFLASQAGFMAA